MKTIISVLLAIMCGTILSSCERKDSSTDSKRMAHEKNESNTDTKGAENDAEFTVNAADAGIFEVQVAELVMKTSGSEKIKRFAEMIMTDHSIANTELEAMADSKNITLPTALSTKNQKAYDDLAKETGEAFDKAYCKLMVDQHRRVIKDFKRHAEKGNNPELKDWAAEKIATLEHHLVTIEEIEKEMNK